MKTENMRMSEIVRMLIHEYKCGAGLMDYDHAVGLIENYFNGEFLTEKRGKKTIDARIVSAFERSIGPFTRFQDGQNDFWESREEVIAD